MTSGQFNADVEQYAQAAAANVPPPPITSDPLVSGATPIEQLLRVLGLAANLGDPADEAESREEHAKREAQTLAAAEEFAAQDAEAAAAMNGLTTPDPAAQMAQQLPQMASGIAGALSGAIGGVLQPFSQIPQQIAQGAQQALQTGMGLFQQAGGSLPPAIDDAALAADPFADEFGSLGGDVDDLGGLGSGGGGSGADAGGGVGGGFGGGGGGLGGTAPMGMLGPPAIPSPSTSPSSAPTLPTPPPVTAPPTGPGHGGMAGMPMVPPAAMSGAAGERETKTDTKRIAAPTVRNGAPVQGRLTAPPSVPVVTTRVDGAPVATRRVILPHNRTDEDQPPDGKA